MTDANTICHDVDLLGDWLDAKGYTEEAGLCLRVLGLIHERDEEIEKTKRFYIEAGFELRQLWEESARLRQENAKLQRKLHDATVKYQRLLMQYEPEKAAGLADATFKGDDNVG